MTQTMEQKIKKLVEEESSSWLLSQFTCDEDDIFASEALKEVFEDKDLEISIEALKYLVKVINDQLDEELENADY